MKKTITTIFMVPTLKIPKGALRLLGFINAFQYDIDREIDYGEGKVIYLLFKHDDIEYFREFLDAEYDRTEAIIEDYDYPNGFVVLVYKLDSTWNRDFSLIKRSKYSKTSPAFQKMFPKVIKIIDKRGLHKDEISLQHRVFNKTLDLIAYWEKKIGIEWTDDMEVWPAYDESKEILNMIEIKNEYNNGETNIKVTKGASKSNS